MITKIETGKTVFPTRVGVYRSTSTFVSSSERFPHTRGGVPLEIYTDPTWKKVFPTRVGVYRSSSPAKIGSVTFSPHAWGCTFNGGL